MKQKKKRSCSLFLPAENNRTLRLAALFASLMVFTSLVHAQVTSFLLPEQYYMALPAYVGDWQVTTDSVVCERTRTVTDGGCWYDDSPDGASYYCDDPDHGIADTQVGVYVPGTGCTGWTTTSYTWVSGDGSQQGTLQNQ
ncbi:MAG TPA: hypothetical protein VFV81_08985 [Verrucomicrobiae bacterium]|nr:hypothetical protein [Verrucomicrobiae bacterium]